MAPIITRTMVSSPIASLQYPPISFSVKTNAKTLLNSRKKYVFVMSSLWRNVGMESNVQRRREREGGCQVAVTEEAVAEVSGEVHEYQAEVSRLLDLIVHSLYSHKEVFLRELVSNASDALDKLRFLSVTDPSLLGDAGELKIQIKSDADNETITITDTGIGMTKEELVDCLGTIAQSGTSKFLKALKENKDLGDSGLIGQFGVGFYSAFLVTDKVVVSTKSPRSDKQYDGRQRQTVAHT